MPADTYTSSSDAATALKERFTEHLWHQLACACPSDWEILHFQREARRGSLIWGDRRCHRLELNWASLKDRPSMSRLISDARSRFRADERVESTTDISCAGWNGFEVKAPAFHSTRFLKYLEEPGLLLEVVFLWPKTPDKELQHYVLNSIQVKHPQAPLRQHWKAFGIDLAFAEDWPLTKCTALPASTTLLFKPRENERYRGLKVQRLGMTDLWMKRPVQDWLEDQLPRGLYKRDTRQDVRHGHEIIWIRARRRRLGGIGHLLRSYHYLTAAWLCPHDRRLYHFEITSRQPINALQLRCCQAHCFSC